jgi:hypothetical protein
MSAEAQNVPIYSLPPHILQSIFDLEQVSISKSTVVFRGQTFIIKEPISTKSMLCKYTLKKIKNRIKS